MHMNNDKKGEKSISVKRTNEVKSSIEFFIIVFSL